MSSFFGVWVNPFFRSSRRWAGNSASVFCAAAAVLLLARPAIAQAQETEAQPIVTAQTAPGAGQPIPLLPSVSAGASSPGAATVAPSSVTSESCGGQCEFDSQSVPEAPTPQSGTPPQGQTQAPGQTTPQGQPQNSGPNDKLPQTSRILEIIPNFRAVSTDEKLPPMSVKQKFVGATEDSFDYSAIFIPLMLAGYSDATKATPEFGHGAPAYARYFWHTAVDQTSENYWVEFIVPSITHEDTRYYTLGRGGFMKRFGYALSRAVVTRNDKGTDEFNFSEIVGAGAASGVSSLYYPSRERSLGNVGTEWGLDVAIDSMSFVVKEFWPDVNHALFHRHDASSAAASH
jgi:hypothetical protein